MECEDIDLIRYMESGEMDPAQKEHIRSCPQCRTSLESFSRLSEILTSYYANGLEPESLDQDSSSYASLPDNLRKVLHRKNAETKTRKALEALAQKTAKSKQWVEDMVSSALRVPGPMDAPAARDDLIKTRDDTSEETRTQSEPGSKPDTQSNGKEK